MRVRAIDREVRPVDAIAEHAVAHLDDAVVARDAPAIRRERLGDECAACAVGDREIEQVLRKIVKAITAGRRSAHVQVERVRGALEADLHEQRAIGGIRDGEAVDHRTGRMAANSGPPRGDTVRKG